MKSIEKFEGFKLSEQNIQTIKGGATWVDAFWMSAEKILDIYIEFCKAVQEGYENGTITNVGSKR